MGTVIRMPRAVIADSELVNVDIAIEKHQLSKADIKTEIQRIIAYFLNHPDSDIYVWGKRGAVQCWTVRGCCTVWDYYNRLLIPVLKESGISSISVLRRAMGCPVWSANDEIICYMETAGMLEVSSDRMTAKPTGWLFEVGKRGKVDGKEQKKE